MLTRHSPAWIGAVLIALAACLAPIALARGDGKAFHSVVPNLSMPDQQAIIVWKDGVQTLVISTAIDMPATTPDASAAWVIPLPTQGRVPEIFAVEPGVFDAARAACTPRLAKVPEALAPALFAVGVLVWIVVLVPNNRNLVLTAGAIVFSIVLLLTLLPTLGSVRGGTVVESVGVRVLDSRRVGAFDTVTLSSTDPDELVRWLTDHKFSVTPGIESVIEDHVKAKWVFVASRLSAEALAGRLEPHPLGFRFATADPVYPLRLTGVGNTDLEVDLFVFGPGTADTRGFRVARSGRVDVTMKADLWRTDGVVRVSQPELAGLAAGSLWLTRLSATLTPRDMEDDAYIAFERGRDMGGLVYSAQTSREFGVAAAGVAVLLLALVAAVARRPSGASDGRRMGWFASALAFAGAVGVALGSTRTVVPVRSERRFGVWDSQRLHKDVAEVLAGYRGAPRSLAELHDAAAQMHVEAVRHSMVKASPREGIGPLQWRIVSSATPGAGFSYEYRDVYGAPTRAAVR